MIEKTLPFCICVMRINKYFMPFFAEATAGKDPNRGQRPPESVEFFTYFIIFFFTLSKSDGQNLTVKI